MKDNVLEKKPEVYRPPSQRKTSSSSLDYQVKDFGDAGYRSRYLSHAKRALYHLSYTPTYEAVLIECYESLEVIEPFINSKYKLYYIKIIY